MDKSQDYAVLTLYLEQIIKFDETFFEFYEKKLPPEVRGITLMDWKQRRQELIDLARNAKAALNG